MFASSVQPPLVSLLASSNSSCLDLFKSGVDASLPSDSLICFLNDSTSRPEPPGPAQLIRPLCIALEDDGDDSQGRTLDQTVLHIQSPTLRSTFIRCPALTGRNLGLKHPWLHFQVRNLGREWSFEVGVVDRAGREGVVRCSTFQTNPTLKMITPPLLHLPLSFPRASTRPLTAWSTINLNLPSFIPHFSSAFLISQEDPNSEQELTRPRIRSAITVPVPTGTYSHISYIKVYATCRLRRIWLSEAGPGQALPLEFELFSLE
ncbi:hypothetical protein BDY19DRAFT_251865 [Irpex rosettiformis]|uniref:Uncharacterized protein n=1 Tax=Irpex rosettiformis TaxID=378272 RepID=A0ACB8TZJ3_9APHY|nr:hypothetical protein BDY19DRAFT_251865 [Irpex rosettiformis]